MSPPSDPPPTPASPAPPGRRLRRALQAVLGLLLGLGLTEAAFRARDGGAFPLLNVYERDEARGVRLRPGSATTVGQRGERVTHVRVNADGYRGPAFPPPTPGEVLVVGDSLSFGLGVDEGEALAARLHAALPGHPAVLDASVPTYGPPEYRLTAEQVLAKRRPAAVVVAINLINDFDEIAQANPTRHTAVDGWAVRVGEGAPPSTSPLRAALIQRSHAAFAVWRWRRAAAALVPPGDGVGAALAAAMNLAQVKREGEASRDHAAAQRALVLAAREEMAAMDRAIVALGSRYAGAAFRASPRALDWHADLRHEPHPEATLFSLNYGGCVPSFPRGLRSRGRWPSRSDLEIALLQLQAVRAMPQAEARAVEEAFVRRDAAEARIREVHAARAPWGLDLYEELPARPRGDDGWTPEVPAAWLPPHPLRAFLEGMAALARDHEARLIVVAVPLDAQISAEARARRGLSATEAAALDGLVARTAAVAGEIGAVGVDPTEALRRLGAAAYLGDGHLSAAGHEAVAAAIAGAIGGG
jgi:hypothetical protein